MSCLIGQEEREKEHDKGVHERTAFSAAHVGRLEFLTGPSQLSWLVRISMTLDGPNLIEVK